MKVCPTCWILYPDSDEGCSKCFAKSAKNHSENQPTVVSKLASVWKWVTLASVVVTLGKGASHLFLNAPSESATFSRAETSMSSSSRPNAEMVSATTSPASGDTIAMSAAESTVFVRILWSAKSSGTSGVVVSKDGLVLVRNSMIENGETWIPYEKMSVCIQPVSDGYCKFETDAVPLVRNPALDLAVLKTVSSLEWVRISNFSHNARSSSLIGTKFAYAAYASTWKPDARRGFTEGFSLLPNGNVRMSVPYFPWAEWGGAYSMDGSFAWIVASSNSQSGDLAFTPAQTIEAWLASVAWKEVPLPEVSSSDFSSRKSLNGNHWGVESSIAASFSSALSILESPDTTPDQAVATGKAALVLRPDDPRMNYLVGKAYAELGKHSLAIPHLEKATNLSPWNFTYPLAFAKALNAAWRYSDAIALCNGISSYPGIPGTSKSKFLEEAAYSYGKIGKNAESSASIAAAMVADSSNQSAALSYSNFSSWSEIRPISEDARALARIEQYRRLHFANRSTGVLSNDPVALGNDMKAIKSYAREDMETSWFVNNRLIDEVRKYYVPNLRASW